MWYENFPRARWSFLDREESIAHFDLNFPIDSGRDALWIAIKAESRIAALSDCALLGRSLIIGAAQVGAAPATGSNLASGMIILHTVADTHTSIAIPGIRADLLDQDGCFAQQRINMLHPDIVALCAAISAMPLVSQRGDLIDSCSGGGAVNLWTEYSQRSG